MKKTAAGLPNTCAGCGKPITEGTWYAKDDETAISGLGFHSLQCAAKYPALSGYTPPPKKQPAKAAPKQPVKEPRPKVAKAEPSKKRRKKTE
jgi:hypothetical protein